MEISLLQDIMQGKICMLMTYRAAIITFLNENLGLVGAYALHDAQANTTMGRMLAQINNFAYFAYRGRRMSNGLDGG